jgi:hypothetical protein
MHAERRRLQEAQRAVGEVRQAMEAAQSRLSAAQGRLEDSATPPVPAAGGASAPADRYAAINAMAESSQARRTVVHLLA